MATLFGWLFDAYPSGQGMTVWLIDPDGRAHPLQDSFTPAFYVSGPSEGLRAVAEFLRGKPVNLRRTGNRQKVQNQYRIEHMYKNPTAHLSISWSARMGLRTKREL